jgi:hypothetical protein
LHGIGGHGKATRNVLGTSTFFLRRRFRQIWSWRGSESHQNLRPICWTVWGNLQIFTSIFHRSRKSPNHRSRSLSNIMFTLLGCTLWFLQVPVHFSQDKGHRLNG